MFLSNVCRLAASGPRSGPAGFVKEGVDQVDEQSQHGRQGAQNKIAHAVVVGIVRLSPPRRPPVLLGSVPRRLAPPRCGAEQSAGAFVEPLLFFLQFPPNSRGLRLAETGVSFWEQALSNRCYDYIQKHHVA